jgi:H+/Cl- antiporter ClcA
MADATNSGANAAQPTAQTTTEIGFNPFTVPNRPKLWAVILMALIAIIFAALFLGAFGWLYGVLWTNTFVAQHRWTIPVGVIAFSLLVGLTQRYLRAPDMIHWGLPEAMKGGGGEPDATTFPGALIAALLSLVSGASIGPEGSLSLLALQIAAWIRQRLKLAQSTALGFGVAAVASALNGVIGSPLFTGVFASELQVGGSAGFVFLAWNLLAGVIGYLFFTLLKLPVFASSIPFTPISTLNLANVGAAILLGVVGALLAVLAGVFLQVFERLVATVFADRIVLRVAVAGVIIGVICYFLPEVMFTGDREVTPIIQNPAQYGVALLLFLGVLKLALLALSLKSGFLGGPTFPILFACTMFGLAFHLLLPATPLAILVLCIEAGALALALGAPLTAILLVATIGTSDPYMIALLVVSAVVGLMVGVGVRYLLAQRTAQQARTGG